MAKEPSVTSRTLERLRGEHATKIKNAAGEAAEEAAKPEPDKDEVGQALGRALDYARKSNGFAEEVAKLVPHVKNAVGWLGENWHKLLPLIGLQEQGDAGHTQNTNVTGDGNDVNHIIGNGNTVTGRGGPR